MNKSPEICASFEPLEHFIRRLIKDDKQGRYLIFEYIEVRKRISGIVWFHRN